MSKIIFFLSLILITSFTIKNNNIKPGKSSFIFQEDSLCNGVPFKIWTYVPMHYTSDSKVLFVLHGNKRNADVYRNQWTNIAERNNTLLIVPEFSRKYFPRDVNYNMGNIFKMDSTDKIISPNNRLNWTYSVIEPLFDFVKKKFGNSSKGYFIYGHSAGSQFVHRFILFIPNARVEKAVSANAGWYTLPDTNITFPYGLKSTTATMAQLKKSFSKHLTVLLGMADTLTMSKNLRRTPEAMQQGKYRFKRGFYFFNHARKQAKLIDSPFNWEIKVAPGIGHNNNKMKNFAENILFN